MTRSIITAATLLAVSSPALALDIMPKDKASNSQFLRLRFDTPSTFHIYTCQMGTNSCQMIGRHEGYTRQDLRIEAERLPQRGMVVAAIGEQAAKSASRALLRISSADADAKISADVPVSSIVQYVGMYMN